MPKMAGDFMLRNHQEMRSMCLRYETQSAIEESLKMGVDPRQEYEQLVWVLQQRLSNPSSPGKFSSGVLAPEGRFCEALGS
jgi:hypothetical protein